jgi:hypothetical protein
MSSSGQSSPLNNVGQVAVDRDRNSVLATIAGYLAPFRSATAITPSNSAVVDAGRQFAVFCTVAGNVKVTFSGGGTLTFPVATGFTLFNWSITQVFVTGTTATAVYTNLS